MGKYKCLSLKTKETEQIAVTLTNCANNQNYKYKFSFPIYNDSFKKSKKIIIYSKISIDITRKDSERSTIYILCNGKRNKKRTKGKS